MQYGHTMYLLKAIIKLSGTLTRDITLHKKVWVLTKPVSIANHLEPVTGMSFLLKLLSFSISVMTWSVPA